MYAILAYAPLDPGLIPGMESLTNGDIGRKRKMLTEVGSLAFYCAFNTHINR